MSYDFIIRLPLSGEIGCRVCSKKMWERIQTNDLDERIQAEMFGSREFIVSGHIKSKFEVFEFIRCYKRALLKFKDDNMDIMRIPEDIDDGDADKVICKLKVVTIFEKLVYDYSGVDYLRQADMLITDWWMLAADAVKYNIIHNKGEDGKRDLNSAWCVMHDVADETTFI